MLVDEEVLANLGGGGPFASVPFIQERLDAFADVWGGAAFRLRAVPGRPGQSPLLIGAFRLSGDGLASSLRVYARTALGPGLVRAAVRDAVPDILDWPAGPRGEAQFLVRWTGPSSGRGSRAFGFDLWRRQGRDDVVLAWSTDDRFADGLWVTRVAVRPGEIRLRYELRYPGWKPGCEGQTEQDDVYRPALKSDGLTLGRREVVNGWHRDVQAAAARLFAALAAGDARVLRELVPDAGTRGRLHPGLVLETACDARAPGGSDTVIMAAAEMGGGRAVPWSLTWTRSPRGWRLTRAVPVLH
jgi:hypothetical protein